MRAWLRRRALLLVGAASLALLTTACGSGGGGSLTAVQLGTPTAIPAGTFTDTAGQPYDLQQRAKGKLTLVYFGYTNCPDVCPTTMADLGTALRSLPAKVDKDVQVVFITSDPTRDTPPKIKAWLGHFDSGVANPFIGLRTSVAKVDAYGRKLGIALEPPVTAKDGSVEVTHGAQTLAFAPDTGKADYVFLPGTTSQQYAHDIKHFVTT
jgi:protein SCO1/2